MKGSIERSHSRRDKGLYIENTLRNKEVERVSFCKNVGIVKMGNYNPHI